jgi:hypothetical protein
MTPLIGRVGKPVGEAGGENAMVYFCLTPLVSQPELVDGEEGIRVKEVRADRSFWKQKSSSVNPGSSFGRFLASCATATYFPVSAQRGEVGQELFSFESKRLQDGHNGALVKEGENGRKIRTVEILV